MTLKFILFAYTWICCLNFLFRLWSNCVSTCVESREQRPVSYINYEHTITLQLAGAYETKLFPTTFQSNECLVTYWYTLWVNNRWTTVMKLCRSACVGVILDLPPPPSSTALAGDTPTGGRAHSSCQTMLQSYPSSLQSGIRYIIQWSSLSCTWF